MTDPASSKDRSTGVRSFLRKALVPFATALFFFTGLFFLGWLSMPVGSALYYEYDLERMEEKGEDIDVFFLGSSRIFRAFVPEVYEKELGVDNCFVGGTSGQRIEDSYYMLEDLCRRTQPAVVVLGVQWNTFQPTDEDGMEHTLKVNERLSIAGRAGYLWRNLGTDMFPQLFDLYRRRFDFSAEQLSKNLSDRISLKESGYVRDMNKLNTYFGKGFIYANRSIEDGNIAIEKIWTNRFDPGEADPLRLKYLDRICGLCAKKGIRLILVSPPGSLMGVYSIDNFQGAADFYTAYAREKGIEYHNLNYMRNRVELFPDHLMYDGWHFSGEGAYELSAAYGKLLKRALDGEDISGSFYKDLDELKETVHRVVAVGADFEQDGNELTIRACSLHNDDVQVLYSLELSLDGGQNYEPLSDWTEETVFHMELPDEDDSRIRLRAALSPEDEDFAWQDYEIAHLFDEKTGGEEL
ncbi:MAG: hypothetical protein IK115_03850 [Lachnospiraceae bacterium]|nr:hypothetical protein [Lachnospiraceae bacterium]